MLHKKKRREKKKKKNCDGDHFRGGDIENRKLYTVVGLEICFFHVRILIRILSRRSGKL